MLLAQLFAIRCLYILMYKSIKISNCMRVEKWSFLAKRYLAKWNCVPPIRKVKLFHYANSRVRSRSLDIPSIIAMGIVFHKRRWKITFRSRAITPCVFRVWSQSWRQRARGITNDSLSSTFRPNSPCIWDPWKFAASRPTSAKWMHKFLVVCFRRTAATAANAITRPVSLWLAALASTVNRLINRPPFSPFFPPRI